MYCRPTRGEMEPEQNPSFSCPCSVSPTLSSKTLRILDIMSITPIEALGKLYELQSRLKVDPEGEG